MAYFLPRWEKLCFYTWDARLKIDNKLVENAIRPVAEEEKIIFLQEVMKQAQCAAMVSSLLATCKLHWLRDVLEHMQLFKLIVL